MAYRRRRSRRTYRRRAAPSGRRSRIGIRL